MSRLYINVMTQISDFSEATGLHGISLQPICFLPFLQTQIKDYR